MLVFCFIILAVNLLFLFLDGLQFFADYKGIIAIGNDIFSIVALQYVPAYLSWIFVIVLVSALFLSADWAITDLTALLFRSISWTYRVVKIWMNIRKPRHIS